MGAYKWVLNWFYKWGYKLFKIGVTLRFKIGHKSLFTVWLTSGFIIGFIYEVRNGFKLSL